MKINKNQSVGNDTSPYIIAEIGSNHNGDMNLAKDLITAAKKSGAHCVKFQSWTKSSIFSKHNYDKNYFLNDDYRNRDDYNLEEIVEAYSMSEDQLVQMKLYANELKIDFTTTPFSKSEVDFMVDKLDVDFIKIASMDVNNYSFLEYIASKGKPIVMSTGLSTLSEIDNAIRTIENTGNKDLILLHCVAIYPQKYKKINLKNIVTLKSIYDYPIGYSDHSIGHEVCLAAVALGACLIEKHFTLDKNMEGWDHKISADPDEMSIITKSSKNVFEALGNKRISQTESKERINEFRRSIVAARDIKINEIFKENMIDFKRPGIGIQPEHKNFIIGKKALNNIMANTLIKYSDV